MYKQNIPDGRDNKNNIFRDRYLSLARLLLAAFLLILPFLSSFPNMDEIMVVIFMVLSCGEYFKRKTFPRIFFLLFTPMGIFCVFAVASGIINRNSGVVTMLGTYDYIKNFLVIFVYATFFRDFNEFGKLFRLLLISVLVIGTIALVQFTWAMSSVYVFNKDILDPSVYLLFQSEPLDVTTLKAVYWRYGIFRAPITSTAMGLYCLLILTVYLYNVQKINIIYFIILISGNISSASRMVYVGLVYVLSMRILKKEMRIAAISLLIVAAIIFIAYASLNGHFPLSESPHIIEQDNSAQSENIRIYSAVKTLEVWKDHAYWGVGPGVIGGTISFKFNSHIYSLYNIGTSYIEKVGSIEQFWPQILAETGIIGTLCFISFIIIFIVVLNYIRERSQSEELKKYFLGLMVFIPCFAIITFGSGINVPAVLFTYCAFVGIGLGSFNEGIKG